MRTLTVIALSLSQLVATTYAQSERPLPVRHSATLSKRGVTYVIEGRQTIPSGCRISISRGVRLGGRGKDPVLVVE